MKINFSPEVTWSDDRMSVLLHAHADGKSIRCVVAQEFLTAPYAERLSGEKARVIFHERKSEIEVRLEARGFMMVLLTRWAKSSFFPGAHMP